MERLVFSKIYILSLLTFIRDKLLKHIFFSETVQSFPSYLLPHVQGLLRQLVLVPGLDATHHICPSSDPQLAVLSVPPLLSDLPVIGREGDDHVTSYGNLQTHFTRHLIQYDEKDMPFMFSCFLASLLVCLSLCLDHELSETEERVSVGLERPCSEPLQGQMWFNPLSKGLYLCDGTVWITVLEGENPTSNHPLMSKFLISLTLKKFSPLLLLRS